MSTNAFLPARTFIIAEAGVNHNGDPALARQLIDAAKAAGADAVKFQLFDPEEIASHAAPLAAYQKESGMTSQMEMLRGLALSHDVFRELADYAAAKKIHFIVTPFDAESAVFLASIGVSPLKIPSGEVTNLPFLAKVAALRVPVIMSTGTCSLEEVRDAVQVFREQQIDLVLLHCTSAYPTPYEQVHLRVMDTLTEEFGVLVGLSDHTEGIAVPIAAVALGARIIEKHFTLDRTLPGPDHKASLEPAEFTAMVQGIRAAEAALGSAEKRMQEAERDTAAVARRSVVAVRDLQSGEVLTAENTVIRRPGTGIAPKDHAAVLGRTLRRAVPTGTPVMYDDLV